MKLVISILCLFISGCSGLMVSNINRAPVVDQGLVTIQDDRTLEEKQARRDSMTSPVVFFAEDEVSPPAFDFLLEGLLNNQEKYSALNIIIDDFYIIDYFPARIKSVGNGSLISDLLIGNGASSAEKWGFIKNLEIPSDENGIVCIFAGTINGKSVKVASYQKYNESPFSTFIRNDEAFIESILLAIEDSSLKILKIIEG